MIFLIETISSSK